MKKNDRKIILGLDLDGAPVETGDPLFVSRMGGEGFLDFLEIHCGIENAEMSTPERIAGFMGILAENPDSFPSFRASWLNAPFAAARRMLEWIDDWYLHGWNGAVPEPAGTTTPETERIRELAALDSLAREAVAPGTGRRLLLVLEALRSKVAVPLGSLEIVDPEEYWPVSWRRIFELFTCEWKKYPEPVRIPETTVIEFDSALSGAKYLDRQYLARANDGKTCFLLEDDGDIRDELLLASGRPQTGTRGKTGADPASQILPLALSLHRSPPDMNALLSFLSLPVCPLGGIRFLLARAIVDSGGMYGEDWNDALEKSLEYRTGKGKNPADFDEFISGWIPKDRYPDAALSRKALLSKTARVMSFLQGMKENADHSAAVPGCAVFTRALERLGDSYDSVPWAVVNDLLSMVSDIRGANSLNRTEAGAVKVWRKSGALTGPCDTLVWYMPQTPSPVRDVPWSKSERNLLSSWECVFPDPAVTGSRPLHVIRRVLGLVSTRVVVMVPSVRTEPSLAELVIRQMGQSGNDPALSADAETLRGITPGTQPVATIALPKTVRWWKVDADVGPDAKWKSSYSQTHVFVERPAQWVLEKKARIKTGTILSLPDFSTFTGTCAHRMVEALVDEHGDGAVSLDQAVYDAWFEKSFPSILERFGYPYTASGAVREKMNFHNRLHSSIRRLCLLLRQFGAANIRLEEELKGTFCGAAFEGNADLVFDTPDGKSGIIDLKYSGWLAGYRDKIVDDKDIQLTIYAELYRQGSQKLPETAYWLFPREKLLARNGAFFPGADIIPSPSTHKTRLGMIEKSIEWRIGQLATGDIEVITLATEELVKTGRAKTLSPPKTALRTSDPFDGFDPYLDLYGWSDIS